MWGRRLVECLGRDRTKHQVAEVTSLGLVQMTRKRVGQGLIEAFSTTCDSCAGRGIHIHMEPIKIKATPVPVAKEIETESGIDSNTDSNTDSDAENFEIQEPAVTQPPAEPAASGPRKKRRRAASSGIITPGSSATE